MDLLDHDKIIDCYVYISFVWHAVKVRNDNYKFIVIYLFKKKKEKMGRKYRGKFVRKTLRIQEILSLKIYLPSILERGSLHVYDKLKKMYFSWKQSVLRINFIPRSQFIFTRRITSCRLFTPLRSRIRHVLVCLVNFRTWFSRKRSVIWKNSIFFLFFSRRILYIRI